MPDPEALQLPSNGQLNPTAQPLQDGWSDFQHDVESGAVASVGMVLQLADGQIAACNANAERMMGMSAAEMTGWRSTNPNWRVVREDGTPFPGEEHPAMVALTTGKPCRDVVMGFYQPDGPLIWLLLNSQPLFQGDRRQPYAVLTTLTEIPQVTPQKFSRDRTSNNDKISAMPDLDDSAFQVESALGLLISENQVLRDREERLRLALEGADLGLWDYDLDAHQLVWSNRCKTLFGLPLNAPITYERFLSTVHPDDQDAIDVAIKQAIHGSMDTSYDLEIRLRELLPRTSHDYRWIRLKGNVYRNSVGHPHRMVGIAIDITNRKWAELNLAESQARFQAFMDNSPIVAFIKDEVGRLLYVNATAEHVVGVPALGKTDFECLPVEVVTQMRQHDRQVFTTGETLQVIEAIPDRTGQVRSWLMFKFLLPTTNGERLLGGMGIEITEQKQTEAQLRNSQQFIQQIADTVPGLLYIYDVIEQRNIYINQQIQDILGYSPAAIQAFGSNLFRCLIHPDDLAVLPQHHAQFDASQSGVVYECEYRMRDVNGEWHWFLSRDTVFRTTDDGHVWQLLGTAQEITERKCIEKKLRHSEERYRCLAECVPQLIWTADASGNLNDINQRWSDYTGLTLEQAQGDGWVQIVHPADTPALLQAWNTTQRQESLYQVEARLRSTSGSYRWFLIKAMPVKNDHGKVLKWYGTSTDIDDQKQLALERYRALELEHAARTEAEKANRLKDDLLMTLSHELRTPLNPILGWCRLLQTREFGREKTLEALASIERNAKQQLQLVQDLLDVARLLQGGLQLRLGLVNLEDTIETAIASVQTTVEAKHIELTATIESKISPILGDSMRLQQIVWNLLSNAIKFTPDGGKVIVCLSQTQNAVQLQVIDTGAGIDPAFLPHVFELFRQSSSSTTRQYGGLGLGLSIVRHLVQLHGGTVEAQSPGRNQGATFTVQFPFTRLETKPMLY
jgi:PAS domain S-box-containing protein